MDFTCQNSSCEYYQKADKITRHCKNQNNGRQRWLCKSCNRTFTEPPPPAPEIPKKSRKGKKGERGKGYDYDEVKQVRGFRITDIAYEGLGEVGQLLGITTGELVERVGRSAKDSSKREQLLELVNKP